MLPHPPWRTPCRPREIGADPARMSTRSTRVERQLHAVAQAFAGCGRSPRMPPRVDSPLSLGEGSRSGSEIVAEWRAIVAVSAPISPTSAVTCACSAGFLGVGLGRHREPTARSSDDFRPLTRNYGEVPGMCALEAP